jgi:hypothetical protein
MFEPTPTQTVPALTTLAPRSTQITWKSPNFGCTLSAWGRSRAPGAAPAPPGATGAARLIRAQRHARKFS